jgi:quercetin dioxygenase-like cupin family protein
MAKAGDVVESLTTRLVFVQTAADTGGELLRFEQTVQPGAPAVAEHVHPWQEERFEVLSGAMGVRLEGAERVLGAGESVVIPRGARHQFWNAGPDELRQVVELRPANRTEDFFEQTFRMQGAGRISESGVPNPLLMAPVALRGGVFLAGVPVPVQRVAFGVLAAVGRVIGHHPADGRTGPPRPDRPSARTGAGPASS